MELAVEKGMVKWDDLDNGSAPLTHNGIMLTIGWSDWGIFIQAVPSPSRFRRTNPS
jgi:hypothetical protein